MKTQITAILLVLFAIFPSAALSFAQTGNETLSPEEIFDKGAETAKDVFEKGKEIGQTTIEKGEEIEKIVDKERIQTKELVEQKGSETIQKLEKIIKDDEDPLGWILRIAIGIIIAAIVFGIAQKGFRKKPAPKEL